jgi:hypothetical protein
MTEGMLRTTEVQSWFSSTHILTHNESGTNEASQYKLRLRPCSGFPVGITVALSCLRQDSNHEGVDPRRGLQR